MALVCIKFSENSDIALEYFARFVKLFTQDQVSFSSYSTPKKLRLKVQNTLANSDSCIFHLENLNEC